VGPSAATPHAWRHGPSQGDLEAGSWFIAVANTREGRRRENLRFSKLSVTLGSRLPLLTNGGGRRAAQRQMQGVGYGPIVPFDTGREIADIYGRCFRGVYGYCAYRLYTRSLAEDATSTVFLKLVEKYPALRSKTQREIRNWLYGTASNVVASYLRDAARREKIAAALSRDRANLSAQDPRKGNRFDWPVLYEAMRQLTPEVQAIVALRYFEGLTTSEIAESLGLKHVTVRVRLSRAIKSLRERLERRLGPYRTT